MGENVCCSTLPPVIISDYVPKGIYSHVGDTKVYVTGPENASQGLLTIYDIFGYFPPTIQGADIIATALGIRVVIPDLFDGEPMDIKNYPPDTEEKKQKVQAFFNGKARFGPNVERVKSLVPQIKAEYKVDKWAIMGLCFGGKVSVLCSQEGTSFVASVQVHPALLDPNEADKIVIPHICLPSKDENQKDIAEFTQRIKNHSNLIVKEKSIVKPYPDMIHGWMGARADLRDEVHRKGYEQGYADVISFLRKNLLL